MAKIIQTSAQRDALKRVTTDLRQLKMLNEFINRVNSNDGNDDDTVIFTASSSRQSIKLAFDVKSAKELLLKQKIKTQKDITANVTKFNITLDDNEQDILEQ